MNGPTFNIGYDPILSNPFPQAVDYTREIDERVKYLQAIKDKMAGSNQQTNPQKDSLWTAIDNEIGSLNDEQRNILFSDTKYIQIDNQLKQLVQEALINSVKNVIEQSPNGNINLYEKWFPNATNNEIEDKIIEATISNWFEDEDASSDKVWEYFRVI